MNAPQTPLSQLSAALEQRRTLTAWIELRDQLAHLNARLQYVSLMIKMGVKPH